MTQKTKENWNIAGTIAGAVLLSPLLVPILGIFVLWNIVDEHIQDCIRWGKYVDDCDAGIYPRAAAEDEHKKTSYTG